MVDVIVIDTGSFEEFLVCNLYSVPGCNEGFLTLLFIGIFGDLERRSVRNLLSWDSFGDYPFGLDFICAALISSVGDELPCLGKWS